MFFSPYNCFVSFYLLVPQLSHMLSSYDPTEVLFQWTLTTSVETILYCTESSSLLITHKEHMHAATREVALPEFKPATQYTCYISSKTDTGISNSSSTIFTTSKLNELTTILQNNNQLRIVCACIFRLNMSLAL